MFTKKIVGHGNMENANKWAKTTISGDKISAEKISAGKYFGGNIFGEKKISAENFRRPFSPKFFPADIFGC